MPPLSVRDAVLGAVASPGLRLVLPVARHAPPQLAASRGRTEAERMHDPRVAAVGGVDRVDHAVGMSIVAMRLPSGDQAVP